jgi:hypothetical protein
MIPVLILGGLVVGRWWTLPIAAIIWPAVLISRHVGGGLPFIAGAAALGVVNTAAGVAAHKVIVKLFHFKRRALRAKSTPSEAEPNQR